MILDRWLRSRQIAKETADAEQMLYLAQLKAAATATQANERLVAEATNIFNTDDTSTLFDLYNYATGDAIDENSFMTMQRNAYQAWATDGYAHGWIETFVKFVVGRNCWLKARDEDEETQEYLDEFCAGYQWPDGRKEKPWPNRAEEWVRRTFRDGESFVRIFDNPLSGQIYLRFMNPMRVRSGNGFTPRETFGIVTFDNDIERVQTYIYWPYSPMFFANTKPDYIPGTEVLHTKISDSDAKRGRPLLLPVISDLVELNKLLKARGKLHWLRSLYAVEKTVSGAWPELLKAKHAKEKAGADTDSTGTKVKAPNPGSVLEHNENVKYEFKTPNIQALDADIDIRRRGLKILVSLGLSETVGLGDASQNNYSAGELAESPMVTTMRMWQGFFKPDFERIGELVLRKAIERGQLSSRSFETERKVSPDGIISVNKVPVERKTGVQVSYPLLVARDVEKETRALALQSAQGWVSDRTAQIKLDLDPDHERELLEVQSQEEQDEMEDMAATQAELAAAVQASKNGDKSKPYGSDNGRGKTEKMSGKRY